MRKVFISLFTIICLCKCNDKNETVHFTALKENEFDATPFKLPNDRMLDSIKQAHDNCMGISFDANAMLAATKDTFFIGSVINKQSLKIVNTIKDLGLDVNQIVSKFSIVTTPCYEKRTLYFPLKSMLGENFTLQLPGADKEQIKELRDAILDSEDAEMTTGSWIYIDMKDALTHLLDTTKSPIILQYKKNLLDTANIVLMAAESVQNVSFVINTRKAISEPLKALLKIKPSILLSNSTPFLKPSIKFFLLGSNKFEIFIDGFFPMVGQFMKAE